MSCDLYLTRAKPMRIEFVCYACGEPIHTNVATGRIYGHENCERERNKKWVIPANIDVSNQEDP